MLDVKELNETQRQRYSRQIQLPQVGLDGQQKLTVAHALVVGVGGLGCPAAMYLAAAGVGRLTLVDYDQVELSNLQRQIAHTTDDIGKLKTESARFTCSSSSSSSSTLLTVSICTSGLSA